MTASYLADALRVHKGYAAWAQGILGRDNNTCRVCTSTQDVTPQYHTPPKAALPPRLKLADGMALCFGCAGRWHRHCQKGLFVGKEANLQRKVKLALEAHGFYVFNVPGTPMGANGIPDLLVCYRGQFGGLECKVFPNYLSANQKWQAQKIRAAGGVFYTVQSEDDVARVIELFEARRPTPAKEFQS